MAVDVFDEQGQPVAAKKANWFALSLFLRCRWVFGTTRKARNTAPLISIKFPGVWAHGDYAEITASDGIIIYGRSDATLNPGGVRIGTAEIYRQVEQLPEVLNRW